MPIDFQQVYAKIRVIGQNTRKRQETLARQRKRAWDLLELHAADLERLRDKVEGEAVEADPNLRCACPWQENLMSHQAAAVDEQQSTLIAIDGSQIIPDRHEGLLYGLINIGAVVLLTGSANAPEIYTESELLFDEELRNADGSVLDEGGIALRRDARERLRLLELARQSPPPVLALTDGPLELWGAKDPANAGVYQKFLAQYLQDLDKMDALGVTPGGYVDKPAADLVVRLLEVATAGEEELKKLREYHPLQGASDLWLFGRLLQTGERSAVFTLQSSSRKRYSGRRAIHFFYLNVALRGHPALARVEIPQWVAEDSEKLELLHATLVAQSRLLGARPYPYLLHRAHETAKVSFDEREQVEMLLKLELRRNGGEVEDPSNKLSAKKSSGERRSYGK